MNRECNPYSYIGFIFLYSHRIFLAYIIISFAAQALWQFLDESRNAPIDISYLSAEIELTECQLKQSLLNHSSISHELYDYTAVFRDFEKFDRHLQKFTANAHRLNNVHSLIPSQLEAGSGVITKLWAESMFALSNSFILNCIQNLGDARRAMAGGQLYHGE